MAPSCRSDAKVCAASTSLSSSVSVPTMIDVSIKTVQVK